MKSTMNDLKKAILAVLEDAIELNENGMLHLASYLVVQKKVLQNLQSEYNIYFVEPEDEQVDLI